MDLEEAARFLDIFVNAGIITDTDKLIILGSRVTNRSLKEIAGDAGAYQRIKKRRQRAIAAMKLYLMRTRKLRALEEGLDEDEMD